MSTGERKTSLLVLRERECGRLEALDTVTALALVVPGRGRELRLMLVAMAIETAGKLDAINRFLALRNVTRRALDLCMLPFEGILRGRMRLQIEFRGLPSGDVMA